MTGKKVMAIFTVALLMFCPIIAVCSNDTEATDSDKSVLVSADKLNQSQTYSLFSFYNDAFKMVYDGFFVEKFTKSTYKWSGYIYDFYIDTGARTIVDGDTRIDQRVMDLSVKFKVTITMKTDGKIAEVMGIPSYLSGKGVEEINDIVGGTYTKDQVITLTGSMQQKMVFELGGDYYHNNELGYLDKSALVHLISGQTYDVTFAVDGKTLNLKHGTTTNLYQDDVTDYGKAYKDVKSGDAAKVIPLSAIDTRKIEGNIDVTVDGTKQPTRVNDKELEDYITSKAYESRLFLKESRDTTAYFVSSLNTDITPGSISLIKTDVAPTLDVLKTKIEGLKGTYSEDVSDFIDVSDNIKKDLGLMFNVTYDTNGGTGEVPSEEVEEYTEFQIAGNDGISKNGYTFGGWNDGKRTYFPGETYTMGNEDVTLKAIWNKVKKDMEVITDGSGRAELIIPNDPTIETVKVSNGDINVYFGEASVDIVKKSGKPLFVTIMKANDETFYIDVKLGTEEFDGTITIELPYDISEGRPGIWEKSGTTETELESEIDVLSGTISFETSGSGTYVLKYSEEPGPVPPIPPKPTEPSTDNTMMIVCLCILVAVVLAILALAWCGRKE